MLGVEVTAIFSDVAKRYGYESTNIQFVPFTSFRIKQTRERDRIHLRIPHMFKTANPQIIEEIAESHFNGLQNHEKTENSDELKQWRKHTFWRRYIE